jgi:hypothetical protein
MGLRGFERRLERLVEGSFSRAFRSELQPVEIARRLVRELDRGRTITARGAVAPNRLVVYLAPDDYESFASFAGALVRELTDGVRDHAREEGYHFVGPVSVDLALDDEIKQGDFDIGAAIVDGPGGRVGSISLGGDRRIALGADVVAIGRLPTCEIPIDDPRASRQHAEIRPDADGYTLVDLQSMNGTVVNGLPIKEHTLVDGDEITIGQTSMRFDAS